VLTVRHRAPERVRLQQRGSSDTETSGVSATDG
jgi:hypothetical protein